MRLLVPTFLLLAGLLSLIGPFLTIFRETSLNDEKTGDKTEVRGIMDQPRSTERSTKQGKDNYGVLLAISFVSAPGHSQQRSKLRRECLPKVESECASYVSSSTSSSSSSSLLSSCSIKFYIGQPNDISTQISLQIKGSFVSQSDPYPAFESQMADSIRRESIEHGNLVILPMRDTYRDLTNKVIFMMRHALEKERAQYVLKIDNDHCPDTRRLLEAITDSMRTTSSEEEDALYFGDGINFFVSHKTGGVGSFCVLVPLGEAAQFNTHCCHPNITEKWFIDKLAIFGDGFFRDGMDNTVA
mmetsp:Transcript_15246/g.26046  ORF Transcript_15246/g.26046 Transcript_15246/m.26046 type:complete len:300 (+) Transcript_15246:88-987(+)